ncbi:MAG: prephenate dehydrogenase, partial [Chthoniobacteraceae bacterium]
TILGPGLLGGSLALALKARTDAHVTVWARRAGSAADARRCADATTCDLAESVKDTGVVVFATPVGAMGPLARAIAPALQPGALVMDVGSVKACVVSELAPVFAGRARFIGCHPMAGSEQTGLAAARADLFDGAMCILTPDADTPRDTTADADAFWRSVGCLTRTLAPDEHDRAVAWISHLPHLVAAALVQAVADHEPGAFDFCGPGFRDTTRVASGPPEMWTEILGQNNAAVRDAVDGLIEKLRALSTLLASAPPAERDASMHRLLNQAKAQRDRLRLPRTSSDA